MPQTGPEPLLSARAAVVLLLAILVGLSAGGLTILGGDSWPRALLAGGGATGAALLLFHKIIA